MKFYALLCVILSISLLLTPAMVRIGQTNPEPTETFTQIESVTQNE